MKISVRMRVCKESVNGCMKMLTTLSYRLLTLVNSDNNSFVFEVYHLFVAHLKRDRCQKKRFDLIFFC